MVKLYSIFITVICFCLLITPAHSANTEVTQRLERLEHLLQSQGLLDMLQQIDALQQELSSLHGEIELQNHTLEQLKKRQRDLYTDIDKRLQALERGGISNGGQAAETIMLENTDSNTPPLQTLEPIANDIADSAGSQSADNPLRVEVLNNNTGATVKPLAEPQFATAMPSPGTVDEAILAPAETMTVLDPVQIRAQYQQAFKLLKQSRYEQAIESFREFLLVNPHSEYSDNAQYWLGEAFYVKRQFEQALVEYSKLVENFPDSKKLTHSLLKIAFCYYEMGQIDEAQSRLQTLKQQYPGTTAARLADERLKKIAQAEQQATAVAN